jgi:hypothetical protein
MRNVVTVTQEFPTWAAAYAARERLAGDGFDEYGIDRIDIERNSRRFELRVRTDEFHRDQIEHLLRSSGTPFNQPAKERRGRWSAATPLLLAGAATVAAAGLFLTLWPRPERRPRMAQSGERRLAGQQTAAVAGTPMFTLEIDGAPVAVTKGNESEARAIFEGAEFKDKLRKMESDGRPLWNGADGFRIRPASAAEIHAFVQYAETLGFEDDEEGDIVLYLQRIDTPDEFDETQDG